MRSPDELRELTGKIMVDFNQMKSFVENPLILEEGSGIRVRDIDGNWYIDGLSGVFTVSVGHRNPEILEAIRDQQEAISFIPPIMSTTRPTLELTDRLLRLSGNRAAVVKHFTTGSETTEAAVKMARQYHRQTGRPGRYKVISLYRSYHGATMGALTATGQPRLKIPYEPLGTGYLHVQPPIPGVCRICGPGPCGDGCLVQIRDVIESEGAETIAAVIVEPVMLTAGVHQLPTEYLRGLRALCDETGVLLVLDEIVTGMGRLGTWFGADLYDVWPDMACVGKGLSGGYAPVAALLITQRVAEAFWADPSENRHYNAGHTFSSNPISAAAGCAVIDYLENHGVLDQVNALAPKFERALIDLTKRSELVREVRGLGFLWGLDVMPPAAHPDAPVGSMVQDACRRRGLLLRASSTVVTIAPPLTSTEAEIEEMVGILGHALEDVADAFATGAAVDFVPAFSL
jgi:adenosylmethionine-8-amino-7-oxononanoate aminotransferase